MHGRWQAVSRHEIHRAARFGRRGARETLGHEIAHALAEHHREELSEVVLRDPAHPNIGIETAMARLEMDLSLQIRLAMLSRIQESEADQIGMILAQRAGWPVADMVSFYRKLLDADPLTFRDWSHPSAASRLNMAQILAVLLSQEEVREYHCSDFPGIASLRIFSHRFLRLMPRLSAVSVTCHARCSSARKMNSRSQSRR